jgi:hypothetical protein
MIRVDAMSEVCFCWFAAKWIRAVHKHFVLHTASTPGTTIEVSASVRITFADRSRLHFVKFYEANRLRPVQGQGSEIAHYRTRLRERLKKLGQGLIHSIGLETPAD